MTNIPVNGTTNITKKEKCLMLNDKSYCLQVLSQDIG